MNSRQKTQNAIAWEALFSKYDILNQIDVDGQFVITASQIKEYREPLREKSGTSGRGQQECRHSKKHELTERFGQQNHFVRNIPARVRNVGKTKLSAALRENTGK
jgi:hypothetical protein